MAAFCAVDGYKVLAVQCPALHYLYARAHESKDNDSDYPAGRTLFVADVPPEFTEATFKHMLKGFGKVERVRISTRADQRHQNMLVRRIYALEPHADERTLFAHIVLKESDTLRRLLAVNEAAAPLSAQHPAPQGIQKWLDEHQKRYEDPGTLQEEVDKAIADYEAAEEKRRKQRDLARTTTDEEGWTTVAYGRRRGEVEGEDGEHKKKKKDQQMLNFYRWQQREARRDQIAELRRKFEEDKQKIALMRQTRKFRPY